MKKTALLMLLWLCSIALCSNAEQPSLAQAYCTDGQHNIQEDEYCSYYDWRNTSSSFYGSEIFKKQVTDLWEQKGHRSLICRYDSLDMPCLSSNDRLMSKAIINWDDDWVPRSYPLSECIETLLPQLWEEPVSIQELCALFLIDINTCENFVPEMTLGEFYSFISDVPHSATDIFIQNKKALSELVKAQGGRIIPVSDTIEADLDNDGTKEKIELRAVKNEDATLNEYHLFVNGKPIEVFYNTDLSVTLIDLQSYKVICINPKGTSDRNDLGRSQQSILFGFFNGDVRFLGAISGEYSMFTGDGSFLTIEKVSDPDLQYGYAVDSITHEYGITPDGLLYQVSHGSEDALEAPFGWQHQNTTWELRHDMPLFSIDGTSISNVILKSGVRIIIRGISENGYMYICAENGTGGIIRIIRPETEPQDPFAAPGGRRLSYYLQGYDSLAYAG